jgi:uncharacterized membrane protein YvlD (DUF360 family)
VYLLNITIKPIIFRFTLPITGLTFGLFYFVIDFFMLVIIDFVLSRHFDIYGIFWGLFIGVHYFIAFVFDKVNVYILTFVIIPTLVMLCAIVD